MSVIEQLSLFDTPALDSRCSKSKRRGYRLRNPYRGVQLVLELPEPACEVSVRVRDRFLKPMDKARSKELLSFREPVDAPQLHWYWHLPAKERLIDWLSVVEFHQAVAFEWREVFGSLEQAIALKVELMKEWEIKSYIGRAILRRERIWNRLTSGLQLIYLDKAHKRYWQIRVEQALLELIELGYQFGCHLADDLS